MEKAIACDRCISDQVRCRFNPLKQSSCRGCIALDIPCNWTHAVKPRPPPDISYVRYIETRSRLVETHLKNLLPGVNTRKDIDEIIDQETARVAQASDKITASTQHLPKTHELASRTDFLGSPTVNQLIQRIRLLDANPVQSIQMPIDDNVLWVNSPSLKSERLFHGHSSAHILSRDAIAFQHDTNNSQYLLNSRRTQPGSEFSSRDTDVTPQHESSNTWVAEHSLWELPPADLMTLLLDAYFDNAFFPVIHRPLFEKQLREGLHKQEPAFLRLVFLLCANGAKWCDDPRVVDGRWPVSLSAGYRWFKQLELWPRNLLVVPRSTLWDAQSFVILALYLCCSSATYGAWTMIGLGIRRMQDIGSHRMRSPQTLENELHKRCFWSMLLLDRFHSVNLGRSPAMFDWDSDLDNVAEVDDELWSLELDAPPPVQPTGSISRLSIFKQTVGLIGLYGRCLQTVYALDRTKRMIGLSGQLGSAWAVNDINIRLKRWEHGLPSHLQLPSPQYFNNSAFCSSLITMWAVYYELTIAANRPFIAKPTPLTSSCRKICRKAARDFASMAFGHTSIPGSRLIPAMAQSAFSSAMILVLGLIGDGGKREAFRYTTSTREPDDDVYDKKQMEVDLQTCIGVLERAESYIHMAGRLRDIIREFEVSLKLRSSSAPTTRTSAYTSCPEEAEHISFDICGPPDMTEAADEIQRQWQRALELSLRFASSYEPGLPHLEPSVPDLDEAYLPTHPTSAGGLSHATLQSYSVIPPQAPQGYGDQNPDLSLPRWQ